MPRFVISSQSPFFNCWSGARSPVCQGEEISIVWEMPRSSFMPGGLPYVRVRSTISTTQQGVN